eukprot:scaffold270841_cov36-Tisochrysis_lutea.AAC.3
MQHPECRDGRAAPSLNEPLEWPRTPRWTLKRRCASFAGSTRECALSFGCSDPPGGGPASAPDHTML